MKKILRESLPEMIGGLAGGVIASMFAKFFGLFNLDKRPLVILGIGATLFYVILWWGLIYILRAKRQIQQIVPVQKVFCFSKRVRLTAISIFPLASVIIGWLWFNFARGDIPFRNVAGILVLHIEGDTPDKSLQRCVMRTAGAEARFCM